MFEQPDESHDLDDQEKQTPVKTFIDKATGYGLPKYIQNMLIACGYDRLETVAKMNVDQISPSQLNDIDNMLSYLNQKYPSDSRLVQFAQQLL